jgi:uncharacterized protein YdiU (UPF0061 family)
MTEWALSRLGLAFVPIIGESFGSGHYDPKHKPTENGEEPQKQKSSIPATRIIPLGFLYNSANSENIIRELVDEFEAKFCKSLGELMTAKLGLKTFQSKDFEVLINPLMEILSSVGADYTSFFRFFSHFSCDGQKFINQTTFSAEAHSKDNLLNGEAVDCLSFIIKSLYTLQENDIIFVQTEREKSNSKSKKTGSSPSSATKLPVSPKSLELLPLASSRDISIQWKQWTLMYKARFIGEIGNGGKVTAQVLVEEELKRIKRMNNLNPVYCLRQEIIAKALTQITKEYPPILDLAHRQS